MLRLYCNVLKQDPAAMHEACLQFLVSYKKKKNHCFKISVAFMNVTIIHLLLLSFSQTQISYLLALRAQSAALLYLLYWHSG